MDRLIRVLDHPAEWRRGSRSFDGVDIVVDLDGNVIKDRLGDAREVLLGVAIRVQESA